VGNWNGGMETGEKITGNGDSRNSKNTIQKKEGKTEGASAIREKGVCLEEGGGRGKYESTIGN